MHNAAIVGIVLVVGLLLLGGYLALPQYQETLGAVGPLLLLVLLCPLLMYFAMRGKNTHSKPRDRNDK